MAGGGSGGHAQAPSTGAQACPEGSPYRLLPNRLVFATASKSPKSFPKRPDSSQIPTSHYQ